MTFKNYLRQPPITDDPKLARDLWYASARCPAPGQVRRNCQDRRRARREFAKCDECGRMKACRRGAANGT